MPQDFSQWMEIGRILGLLLIAGAVVLVGHWVSMALGRQSARVRLVEIAIDQLSRSERDSRDKEVRHWAFDIVSRYSEVELPRGLLDSSPPVFYRASEPINILSIPNVPANEVDRQIAKRQDDPNHIACHIVPPSTLHTVVVVNRSM